MLQKEHRTSISSFLRDELRQEKKTLKIQDENTKMVSCINSKIGELGLQWKATYDDSRWLLQEAPQESRESETITSFLLCA